jgi:hypothetical protein
MKPPNRISVVRDIDRENPGLKERDADAFTELTAARLAAEDPRWGRYRNTRNNKSRDVLGWRDGQLWGVDILIGAGRENFDPPIAWQVGTRNGTWVFVQPESGAVVPPPPDDWSPEERLADVEARLAHVEIFLRSFE